MEPLWTLPASSLPHPISILPLPTVRARLTAFPVLPPGTPCVLSPAVSTGSPSPGSGRPLPAPRSPLVTPPPQAPAFCVSPAGPFPGHVLSFQLETAALVTEATSPKCPFPHRARETFAEGSDRCRSPVPDCSSRSQPSGLPLGLSQLAGSQTRLLAGFAEETFKSPGSHMKSPPGSSSVILRLKIKSPGTPVAAIVTAIEP